MNLIILLPTFFPFFLFALLPSVNAQNGPPIAVALSTLWGLDAQNRQQLGGAAGEDEGVISRPLQIVGQFARASPIDEAFAQLCGTFGIGNGDEDGGKKMGTTTSRINSFLNALNSTQLFQKASQLYADASEGRRESPLLDAVRALFFMPEDQPSTFDSIFCRFSPDSPNWFALARDQSQWADNKLMEIIPSGEQEVLIRVRGEDGKVRKNRILVGGSLEFELSAISLCALLNDEQGWKHCSAPIADGKQFLLSVKMDGKMKVQAYFLRISSGRMERERKPKPKPRPNPELQKLVEELWAKDVDRVEPGTISLNWQGKLRKDQIEDISPDPLFARVNESFLQKPIYAALVEMYNEGAFHQQVCEEEPPMDTERREKFSKLWGIMTESEVFKTAYAYLDRSNKTGGDFDAFCAKMFDFWFGTYSRCKQHRRHSNSNPEAPLGSSGFEHVFSGEWRQGIVEGHHNWVRYYLQEKAGEINYHGYFGHQQDDFIGTFQYKWKGFLKRIGGFFFQTSPAFDFSLFTVCVLTQPGSEHCQFELFNNTKLFVTSFSQSCQNGTCVATTYPGSFY